MSLALIGAGVGMAAHAPARAANTELDVPNGTTDLTSLGATTTSDLTFTNVTYAPTTFTVNANLAIGTLNGLDATQLLTVTNTGTTASTLTLSTAADSVSGSATTDLLYVASGASLNIANGTSTLGLALGATGNLDVAGTANVGSAVSGAFALNKTGAGTLALTGTNTYTGNTTVGNGTLTFGGASSMNGSSSMDVGTVAGQTGVLNINTTGTLAFATTFNVGEAGVNGVVNQTSGTVSSVTSGGNYIMIGNNGYGSYTLAGGTLTAGSSTTIQGIRVGGSQSGTSTGGVPNIGVLTQTGGTLNVYRYLAIGTNPAAAPNASTGLVTFTGGTANLGLGTYRVLLGDATNSTGIMNVGTEAGGTAVVTAYSTGVSVGANTGASGLLNLNAGVLAFTAGGIFNNTSGITSSTLNLNGGTVRPLATGLSVIGTGLTTANVYNGGVTVDNNAFTTTVAGPLLATTGGGIYEAGGTIAIAGGPTVVGQPIVTIVGGGTGATAIANVSGGTVTGITLTSPGQNYSAGQVLTFNLSGGGLAATTSLTYTLTAADIAANGSGRLTAIGSGTTLLIGSNTYTGGNTVGAGTLEVNNAGALPSFTSTTGINTVAAGATLTLDVGATTGTTAAFTAANVAAVQANTTFASGSFLGLNTVGGSLAVTSAIAGPQGLVTSGVNTLTLGSANTYTGPTNIAAGTLSVSTIGNGGTTSSLGASSNASSNLLVQNGTLLYTGGTATTDRGLTFGTGLSTINLSTGGAVLTFCGQVTVSTSTAGTTTILGGTGTTGGVLAFTNNASTNTFGGNGGFYIISGGVVFPAATNVISGTLRIGNNGPSGQYPAQSAPALLNISGGTTTDTGNLLIAENNGAAQPATLNVLGGTLIVTGGARTGGTTASGSGPSTINVSGGAAFNLGSSTLTLSNAAGTTTTVNLGTGGTATPALLTTGGIANGGGSSTLNFNNGTLQAAASTTTFLTGQTAANILAGGLTVDTQAFNVSVGQSLLTGTTAGTNDGGLTKVGTGTLTLTGSSTYTGGTTISAGTVRANATAATGTNTVTINAGGSLGGNGSTGVVTVANGGTIAAGPDAATTGTLTTAQQFWNAGGAYLAKVNPTGTATTNDELVLTGLTVSATIASPFAVVAASLNTSNTAAAGTPLVLALDTNTGQTNVFANAIAARTLVLSTTSTATFSSGTATLAEIDTSGGEELVLSTAAAPEPTSLLLLGATAAPLALARRRRRATASR